MKIDEIESMPEDRFARIWPLVLHQWRKESALKKFTAEAFIKTSASKKRGAK